MRPALRSILGSISNSVDGQPSLCIPTCHFPGCRDTSAKIDLPAEWCCFRSQLGTLCALLSGTWPLRLRQQSGLVAWSLLNTWVHDLIGKSHEELCQTALSSGIVSKDGTEGCVSKRLGKALTEGFSGAGIIRQTDGI